MKPNKFSRAIAQAATLTAAALAVGSANAGTFQFYNGSTLYATVVTSDIPPGGSGGTNFSLAVASNLNAAAFIDWIYLRNEDQVGVATNTYTFANLAGSDVVGTYSYNAITIGNNGKEQGGFTGTGGEKYNWEIDFPNGSGNADALQAGETALWSITPTNTDSWNFNLLHVNAFDGVNSIKLESCEVATGETSCTPPLTNIPEPGSLALVGLALLAGGVARRKLVQQSA